MQNIIFLKKMLFIRIILPILANSSFEIFFYESFSLHSIGISQNKSTTFLELFLCHCSIGFHAFPVTFSSFSYFKIKIQINKIKHKPRSFIWFTSHFQTFICLPSLLPCLLFYKHTLFFLA